MRESLTALHVDLPHAVIADAESVDPVRARLGRHPGMSVVSSADVLRPPVERRRARAHSWSARLLRNRGPWQLSGWQAQQFMKLSADRVVDTPHWVCVDSDVVLLRPLATEDFYDESGRLHLHEFQGLGVDESVPRMGADAVRFLRLPAAGVDPRLSYVHVVIPLHGAVVADLRDHVESLTARPWETAMARARATEYSTYGLFARHVDRLRRVVPVDRRWVLLCYEFDREGFAHQVASALDADPDLRGVMVHSHLGIDPATYRAVATRAWA